MIIKQLIQKKDKQNSGYKTPIHKTADTKNTDTENS